MLLDGAIRFTEQARRGLEDRDFEAVYAGITRCQAILIELMSGLRPEHDAELCRRLAALYTYMYTRLLAASSARDPGIVQEVLDLLRYDRETWSMLVERLAGERRAAETGVSPSESGRMDGEAAPDRVPGVSLRV